MRGRGMAVVLVPDVCGEFGQSFAWHVSVILFQAVHPDYEIVTLGFRQRQNIVFQFSHAHGQEICPEKDFLATIIFSESERAVLGSKELWG
jgi:hypothetical protein